VREYFVSEGFFEVETPVLVQSPDMEPTISPFSVKLADNEGRKYDAHLITSPEYSMKKLLAAGYEKIFQICKSFRRGERGDVHVPEFTLLEWYRTGVDYQALMDECEAMITFEGKEYRSHDFQQTPWLMLSDIVIDNHVSGNIQVCYSHNIEGNSNPFLPEEQKLTLQNSHILVLLQKCRRTDLHLPYI